MSTSTTQDHSNENEALVATLTTYSSPSPAYEDPDEAIGEIDPMTYIDLTEDTPAHSASAAGPMVPPRHQRHTLEELSAQLPELEGQLAAIPRNQSLAYMAANNTIEPLQDLAATIEELGDDIRAVFETREILASIECYLVLMRYQCNPTGDNQTALAEAQQRYHTAKGTAYEFSRNTDEMATTRALLHSVQAPRGETTTSQYPGPVPALVVIPATPKRARTPEVEVPENPELLRVDETLR
ncbi:hypothetical protein BGX31_003584, partial [Mortierella sp. GBA43]